MPQDMQQIKQGMKATWMAGDFGQIAQHTSAEAVRFVDRLKLRSGQRVLDVACGSGNLAIPAAKIGCVVTGVDIATNLLAQARERAAQEDVQVKFLEGDAEQLQFADGSFDVVITMFGAMFAPRPELTARELVRVCRAGGVIAMANWTPAAFVGKLFKLVASHVPPPPDVPSPVLWGDARTVQQRFGDAVVLETKPVTFHLDYPFAPAGVVDYFRKYFGPTQVAFSKLEGAAAQRLADDLQKLWADHNLANGERTLIEGEYLEVRATKK